MRKKPTLPRWTDGSFGRRRRRGHAVDDNLSLFFVLVILSARGAHIIPRDLRTAHAGGGGFSMLWFAARVATSFLFHFFVHICDTTREYSPATAETAYV